MPYPNEHSCRLIKPENCKEESFRRENGAGKSGDKKFDIIYAKAKDSGETVEQAYRYPTSSWSEDQAREHCSQSSGIKFEPASKNGTSMHMHEIYSNAMHEIYGKSWAITQQGLDSLIGQVGNLDTKQGLMTRPAEEPQNTKLTFIRGSVAIIEVIGPIFHYENIITWILGFPAAETLAREVQAAVDNPQVNSILLRIDSPGGQVGGVNELSKIIENAGKEKQVQAYVADMGASAAYWIASATSKIYVDATAELGSIGVVFGLRRRPDDSLEIVNSDSPQKRPDINTEEGVELIRQRANELAEVFIQNVARNRNMSRDQVVALKGGLKVGQNAVTAGLADEIGSLEGVIETLQKIKGGSMDLETLKQNHADLYEQVKKEGKDEAAQDKEQAKQEGKKEAQNEVLEQAKIIWGDQSAQQLNQVVQSGLGAEQLKKARELFGSTQPSQGDGGQDSSQQILDGLQSAHGHQGLSPDSNVEQQQNLLVENAKQRSGQQN